MANTTDQLNMVTSEEGQRAAFAILDRLQESPQGVQLAALSMMFLLMCERLKQDPRDVLSKGSAVLLDAFTEGRGEYIRAIREYLKGEF